MEFPPDRKPSREWTVKQRMSKEPLDWFTVDLNPKSDNGLRIDKFFVLTCDQDRLEKFMALNCNAGFEFIPYWGERGDIPHNSIFNNYFNILSNSFLNGDADFIGIVEDDVLLLDGAYESLQKSISELPDDWDTLSGNLSMYIKAIQKTESTIMIEGHASSLNLTVFSKQSFFKILDCLGLREKYPHFDRFIFSPECGLSSFCSWPMICRETPGYSINRGDFSDSFGPLIYSEPYKYWFIDSPKWSFF